jgi:hypothetical protein
MPSLSDLHNHQHICPYHDIQFGETRTLALIDMGRDLSKISEEAYQSIIATGYVGLQLLIQFTIIRSAFGYPSHKIKIPIFKFKIDSNVFEHCHNNATVNFNYIRTRFCAGKSYHNRL